MNPAGETIPQRGGAPFTNRQLFLPYAVPYLVYVAIATFSQGRVAPEVSYALRILVVPPLLWWGSRWYVSVLGPRSPWGSCFWGILVGTLGIAFWIGLMRPWVDTDAPSWGGLAFTLRALAAILIVPVFEELFVRGYILRVAYQWGLRRKARSSEALAEALDDMSLDGVAPGAWSAWAVAVSTLVFTAGHNVTEWPSAIVFGLLMAWLWVRRQDLISCIVAHATANALLALFVWKTGEWGLW